jgi:hypothetical protein
MEHGMSAYHFVFYSSLLCCIVSLAWQLRKLIIAGMPADCAPAAGSVPAGVRYSFTGAMSPSKKESAFLHLPTYSAGLLYHAGTFLSLLLLFPLLADAEIPRVLSMSLFAFLMLTAACGTGMLVKRIATKHLRALSRPGDYFSNILVTVFQVITGLSILHGLLPKQTLLVFSSLLLLYIPFGKLKHLLYFFVARFDLGRFFGSRGVWPPSNPSKI